VLEVPDCWHLTEEKLQWEVSNYGSGCVHKYSNKHLYLWHCSIITDHDFLLSFIALHRIVSQFLESHSLCRLKNEKILRIHRKCHQGELFACPHCDKVSATRNNLRMHMKRHSDARPHNCSLCTRAFKTPRDLKVSFCTFTGESLVIVLVAVVVI